MKYVVWLWHNAKGVRWNTLLRVAVGIAQVILGLLMVWLSKQFIDVTIHTGSDADIWMMVAILVAVVVGGVVLRQYYYYLTIVANTRQTNSIRLRIFSRLFHRQLYTEQQLHSGDVVSRLEKDIDAVGEATTTLFPQLLVTTCQLLGAFLLMRSMDARLAWILVLMTPLVIIFGKLLARKLRNMTHDIRQQESRIQMQMQEGIEHNEVLRSLESSDWLAGRLDTMQQGLKTKVMRRTRFTVITRVLLATTFGLGYLLAFIWGGLQLRHGAITFGVMTSFLQLVSQIQHPILQILNMLPQFIHTTASIDRLNELEEMPTELTRGDRGMQLQKAGLRMDDVCFRYATGDRQILNHFSHDFRPGSKTAILGQTGIGKTTLFRLMLALARPDSGRLILYTDGSEQVVDASTRNNFVFVPQGNSLMSGSIRYNLQLARPEATDEELRHALHTATADFVDDLPEGIDTQLGERGTGLSEGQAQRIAIARGLLRPGCILLLDEISSALDADTERHLFERLLNDSPEKTIIFITHREHIATMCDDVLTMGESLESES
ncbi:MAG: ABC transporter ATP-binding protein/permease [Prevotella sp.]|nr:ABC transporter ATP-binding protein/permease [Prevotella sp.]